MTWWMWMVTGAVSATIAMSIILHSSTDVPVAHMLRIEPPDHLPAGHYDPIEPPPAVSDRGS